MAGESAGADLRPGELCAHEGIYKVMHGGAHREPHTVIVRKSEVFPRCNHCGHAVRFALVKQVSEPAPTRAKRVRKKSAGRS
jgi:hypothetical protein